MSRTLWIDCEHGNTLDHGDFGDDFSPCSGLCPICVPEEEARRVNVEYRQMNAHWLHEHHPEFYEPTYTYIGPGSDAWAALYGEAGRWLTYEETQ